MGSRLRRGDRDHLARDLHALLVKSPDQNKRQLLRSLTALGWSGLSTTDVNSVLYEQSRPFVKDNASPPRWRADGKGSASVVAIPAEVIPNWRFERYAGPKTRAWQMEALDAWRAAGRRGVVEAVTGTGKTTVGVMAAADAVARGKRVLVVVPSRDLLDQWYGKLTTELRSTRLGRMGDGWSDTLVNHDLVVSTVQSAFRWRMLSGAHAGLLIADEVHHYGAKKYSRALEEGFDERLGLTATYERSDDGVPKYLTPYFSNRSGSNVERGEVVAGCDYERGLADGILARFRVGLLGVDFDINEREEYEFWDEVARCERGALIRQHDCPEKPFGEFIRAVQELSEGGHGDTDATMSARKYLNAFTKRRALLADCGRKLEALKALRPVLERAERGLVFTETIESAERAADAVRMEGVAALPYTSKLDQNTRKMRLSDFRDGRIRVLAAPRVLDEGVDVPEADLGVILAASQSRRQMIQRMGRIIRPKKDRRPATFLVLYVRGSSEDPAQGAYGVFLEEMTEVAEEVRTFPRGVGGRELLAWYRAR